MPFQFSPSFQFSLNAEMTDYPASGQSGTGMIKNADAGTSPVTEQREPVRYRTEILDARIQMPAASPSM
jgi:hypothetical protein